MSSRRILQAIVAAALLLTADTAPTADRQAHYAMRGMVLKVSPSHTSVIISHDSVPGVMDAMTMAFDVRRPSDLNGVTAGMTVEFTLVMGNESAYVDRLRVVAYQSSEQDPLAAHRLALLKTIARSTPVEKPIAAGEPVPDFTLIDQAGRPVTLQQLRGRIVAVNFIYTNCALPQFCFRTANHFGVLSKRFAGRLGVDLVLLTVTFDPVRDQPEKLAEYASQWSANADVWHFLTGDVPDIRRVCGWFGVDYFPDEGLMNHSSHTALVDRQGRLIANIEGNRFTATQLGDLVDAALTR